MRGKIKWYNSYKKYGFITGEDGHYAFFIKKELKDDKRIPKEGELVEYEITNGESNYFYAINIIFLK